MATFRTVGFTRVAQSKLSRLLGTFVLFTIAIGTFPLISLADTPAQQESQDELQTPYTTALLEGLALRQEQGLPGPTISVESVVEPIDALSAGQADTAQSATVESPVDLLKKTSTITLHFSGPEEAGYETWPALSDLPNSLGESGVDFDQILMDQMADRYPALAALDPEVFGKLPRTVVITESIEYAASDPVEDINRALLANPNASANALAAATGFGAISEADILMGFTYIGPQIWYGIEEQVYVDIPNPIPQITCTGGNPYFPFIPLPTCTVRFTSFRVELTYIKAGLELSWGLGIRLPGFGTISGDAVADPGTTASVDSTFTTKNWDADKYHSYDIWLEQTRCDRANPPDTCDREASEYVAYFTAFAGIKLRILGISPCDYLPAPLTCGIDEEYDWSSDFVTPLGANAVFDLTEIELPILSLPRHKRQEDNNNNDDDDDDCSDNNNNNNNNDDCEDDDDDPFKFTVNLLLTPQMGGRQIQADWNATANCGYNRSGVFTYNRSEPAVDGEVTVDGVSELGEDIQLTDLCDDTTVTISNFRYQFNNFSLKLGVGFDLSILGFSLADVGVDPDDLKIDLLTINLSTFFNSLGALEVGDHMYCTTTLSGIHCEREGPPNLLVHHIDVPLCDHPDVEHVLVGSTDDGVNFRSDVTVNLLATGTDEFCTVGIRWEPGYAPDVNAAVRTLGGIDLCFPNPLDFIPPLFEDVCFEVLNAADFISTTNVYNGPLTFTEQGAYEVTYWGIPSEGTIPRKTVRFVIDKTSPTIEGGIAAFESPPINGWYNDNVTVDFTGTDPVMAIDTYDDVDEIFNNVEVPFIFSLFLSEDEFIDGILEFAGTSRNQVGAWLRNRIAEQNEGRLEMPGSGIAFVTPPQVLSRDGINIHVTGLARDRAGNIGQFTVGPIKIDQTPPVSDYELTVGGNPVDETEISSFNADVTLDLTAIDPGSAPSGVDFIQYSLDEGQSWETYAQALEFSNGDHTVYYRAIDLAGNVEETNVAALQVDTAPPIIACPENIVVDTDEGLASAVVIYDAVEAVDFASVPTIEQTGGLPSGEAFPRGETTNDYQATDAAGNSSQCSFAVTVLNQPPVALDDAYTMDANTILDAPVSGVLGNDTDNENDPLTANLIDGTDFGVLIFNSDGSFSYTPATDFIGDDMFVYTAMDAESASNEATVTITVMPTDIDNDGYFGQIDDCDDTNSSVFPGAPEIEDGLDNDCNGEIDDGICYPNAEADLSGDITGAGVGTMFNASEACNYVVGMASYSMFDDVIDHQVLFDSLHPVMVGPGETMPLAVALPDCAAQVDLFYGDLLTDLNGVRYGERLLDAVVMDQGNWCGVQESAP